MVSIIYLLGFSLSFSYLLTVLSSSLFRIDLKLRYYKAFFISVFWFVLIPYLMVKGKFCKSQRELDEMEYDNFIYKEMNPLIKPLVKMGLEKSLVKNLKERAKKDIGTFDQYLSKQHFFSYPITKNELATLILKSHFKINEQKNVNIGKQEYVLKYVNNFHKLNKSIENDLKDVIVSDVNSSASIGKFKHSLGFHTTKNGFTFLGVTTTCEFPIYFIIYYDGNELRALSPFDCYTNHTTKKRIGESIEEDLDYMKGVLPNLTEGMLYNVYYMVFTKKFIFDRIDEKIDFLPKNDFQEIK